MIAAKKRFASDARLKIQVLESKTPHAVLELFLRNACDNTYPYAWTVNFEMRLEGISAGNSEGISAGNSGGISADDSKGVSTGNSVGISMSCRHSKTVPFSLITPYQNLNFLAPEHRIPIWVILGLGFSVDDIVKDMKLLIFC